MFDALIADGTSETTSKPTIQKSTLALTTFYPTLNEFCQLLVNEMEKSRADGEQSEEIWQELIYEVRGSYLG